MGLARDERGMGGLWNARAEADDVFVRWVGIVNGCDKNVQPALAHPYIRVVDRPRVVN